MMYAIKVNQVIPGVDLQKLLLIPENFRWKIVAGTNQFMKVNHNNEKTDKKLVIIYLIAIFIAIIELIVLYYVHVHGKLH